MADPEGGVLIAFDDVMLEDDPTWTRLDNMRGSSVTRTAPLVRRYSVKRGRQDEFAETEPGTAEVEFNDISGLFDPYNTGSTYYGKLDAKQLSLGLWNPVSEEWTEIYRGHQEDWNHDLHRSQLVTYPTLAAVDALAFFAQVELKSGDGDPLPPGVDAGSVFFEDGAVQDRVLAGLGIAGFPSGLAIPAPAIGRQDVFTGNIQVMETIYDTGSTVMQLLKDTADAEFPGIANQFISKDGHYTWHGRLARFHPDVVDYDITTWKCGDSTQAHGDTGSGGTAQIFPPFGYRRSINEVLNSVSVSPQGIAPEDLAGQLWEDATSINKYGKRSSSWTDLLIKSSDLTGEDGPGECLLIAKYFVENYKNPLTRISQIVFRSMNPDDERAEATWELICGVEISDRLEITLTQPGSVITETYFVEGIEYEIVPLNGIQGQNGAFADVTMTLDVSPATRYDYNPFE